MHRYIFLLLLPLVVLVPICFYWTDAYSDSRGCYSTIDKYQQISALSEIYNRWHRVTPPDYVKVFLPTSGF